MKIWGWALGLAALMTTAMGCTSPAAKQRLARREDNLQRTAQTFADLEAGRTQKLERTGQLARQQHQDDLRSTAVNFREVQDGCRAEFERWENKQPAYRKAIGQELEGDVDNLEPTLMDILY